MAWKVFVQTGLVCLLAAPMLPGQYPGQQYPGQYPPGQGYPGGGGGGGGLPMPRLPGRKSKGPAEKQQGKDEVLAATNGVVVENKAEQLVMAAEDTRMVTFKCSKITKYKRDDKEIKQTDVKSGDHVTVEYRKDDEGYFYAVNVLWQPPPAAPAAVSSTGAAPAPAAPAAGKKEDATAAKADEAAEKPESAVVVGPAVMTGADNEAPPKLKRGKPAPRASKPVEDDPEPLPAPVAVASVRPPASAASAGLGSPEAGEVRRPAADPDEEFIEQAKQVSEAFTESLPNFVVQQITTRYQSEGRPVDWHANDMVTAALVYEDGKESYRDLKVNGKATKKGMEESGGTWSTGEFGTTLKDLLSPGTNAKFYNRRDSMSSNLSCFKYDFEVEKENSHWKTILAGQYLEPAYKGSIWFDKKSHRVMRIEMQARKIPQEFPLDALEWVVDYDFVKIGGIPFLVPVHAENLSCWRGTSRCGKNAIDFRNYRRFTGESQILQTDSNITFDGDEKKPEAPKTAPASIKKQ
ncbi:MAG: hypothetical protein ABI693_24100 [Bryobacteraceae bacterium]